MSEVFSFIEWFDYQKMADLASYVAKQLPVECRVAVGVAEYEESESKNDLLLGLPTIVTISSDGSKIPDTDEELLIDGIKKAAESIVAGEKVDYDINEYPVLTFGLENEDEYVGAIFVAILAYNPGMDKVQQALLAEHIEEELSEIFAKDNENRTPEEDPYTAWYYGTVFGIPLNTQS